MKRIEILGADGAVINTIVADEDFAESQHPGAWRVAAVQSESAPPAAPRRITLGALQKRIGPMKVFAIDTSTHPVCVALRSYLSRLTFVDLDDPDLSPMLGMLVSAVQPASNPVFPGSGPLTASDVAQIIGGQVQPQEAP